MYMFLPANVRIWCNAIEKNHEYCNLFAKQSIQVRLTKLKTLLKDKQPTTVLFQ